MTAQIIYIEEYKRKKMWQEIQDMTKSLEEQQALLAMYKSMIDNTVFVDDDGA